MRIVNITQAKAQLSALVEDVIRGEVVVIGRAGKPEVELRKHERTDVPRRPGALQGQIEIGEDFDELPADIAEAFGVTDQ